MAIKWSDDMSTGFAEIDDEHKELIACINRLTDAMKSGNGRLEIMNTLQYLQNYAESHFLHEESCMNKHKCPAADINRRAHGEFLFSVLQMKENVEKNGASFTAVIGLNESLGDWMQSHIAGIDSNLKSCSRYINNNNNLN